ncbi:MAG: CpsD/CapB family tyrosine-protein kinase [Ruminococcaceae bacterium]|nr:CpsD/CapB family tyrosine-protein kinase [Oscillospiraceae bacterium]
MFDRKNRKNPNARAEYRSRLLGANSDFMTGEAYNKMRTNLMYTLADKKCPVIGVTSAFKGGGKSLTLANLAISYSQLGKQVLIIDGDLRSPVQHRVFNLKNVTGVSEILGGFRQGGISVHKIKEYPNVSVLNAGATPPNPSELLASERMEKLIALVKEKFDMVIIDLPPINVVTDAGVIGSLVDGYVFVVRSGADDARSVRSALDTLKQMNANVLGVVLNDVSLEQRKRYGGRYNRYGYGRQASEFTPAQSEIARNEDIEMTLEETAPEKENGKDH